MRHTRSKRKDLKQHRRRRSRRAQRGGADEFSASAWLKGINTDAVNKSDILNIPLSSFTTEKLPEIPRLEWSTAAYFLENGQEGGKKLDLFMAGAIVKTFLMSVMGETVQGFVLSLDQMDQEVRDQLLMIENALRKTAGRSDLLTDLKDTSNYPLLVLYLANATSDAILDAYTPVLGPASESEI